MRFSEFGIILVQFIVTDFIVQTLKRHVIQIVISAILL